MYSKYTVYRSSTGKHFLTAGFLVNLTYRVIKIGYGWTMLEVTMYSENRLIVKCGGTYKQQALSNSRTRKVDKKVLQE